MLAWEEVVMAGPGRNDPCLCGSGRKVKRCCGVRRGPSEDELAKAFLAVQALAASSSPPSRPRPRAFTVYEFPCTGA